MHLSVHTLDNTIRTYNTDACIIWNDRVRWRHEGEEDYDFAYVESSEETLYKSQKSKYILIIRTLSRDNLNGGIETREDFSNEITVVSYGY